MPLKLQKQIALPGRYFYNMILMVWNNRLNRHLQHFRNAYSSNHFGAP